MTEVVTVRVAAPPVSVSLYDGATRLDDARLAVRTTTTATADQDGSWDVRLDVENRSLETIEAGLVVAIDIGPSDAPDWLIPGLFYGENRPAESRGRFPRWVRDAAAGVEDPFTASGWTFRSDRAAVPVVFGRGAGSDVAVSTAPSSPLGMTGLGFGAGELRVAFPYREQPVVYDGGPIAQPADLPRHAWPPGETVSLELRVHVGQPRERVLRGLRRQLAPAEPITPWVSIDDAAALAAHGLVTWHHDAARRVIYETAAFDRADGEGPGSAPGDRRAMHVAWLSGAPTAAALHAHGRRTGDAAAAEAGARVLDNIAANLAPCGTFWGQWSEASGWGKGWTPGDDALHARTIAEATLFMARAAAAEPDGAPAWRAAVASNVNAVARMQRDDGAIPAWWNGRTGAALGWDGSAGLAWVPAWLEACALLGDATLIDRARRAADHYAQFVEAGFLFGAPEDVDLGPTSEDGYVAVMAYVALARHDKGPARDRWLELARKAADWTLTFRYAYDVTFEPDTLLGSYGFRTLGADMASPANQHLHAYGLVCLPEMVALSRLTGDAEYLDRTRENLACFRQFIARRDGDFNARRGMAPERFYQTRYGGPKGGIGPLSHAWSLGLLLYGCEAALGIPELADER
jgi:hypothetical protein